MTTYRDGLDCGCDGIWLHKSCRYCSKESCEFHACDCTAESHARGMRERRKWHRERGYVYDRHARIWRKPVVVSA